jgi:TPR repeat protein
MQFIEKIMQIENIELYFILFLFFFIIWFIRNTILYYYGEKRKIKNLHRFAKEGEMDAQHDLAQCYHRGKFVKKSCERAAFWYQSAALKGNEEAKGYLENFLQNHQKKKC